MSATALKSGCRSNSPSPRDGLRSARIPQADYKKMAAKAKFDMALFRRYESKVEHEVVAFVSAVGDLLGDLSSYLHLGLTSSDVMDTAQSMQMQEALGGAHPAGGKPGGQAGQPCDQAQAHGDDGAYARHPRRADYLRPQGSRVAARAWARAGAA